MPAGTRSLPEGFELFAIIHKVTTTHAVITRITQEVLEDCTKDNIIHLELRTTPKVYSPDPMPVTSPHVPHVNNLHWALAQARPEHGMTKESYCKAVLAGIQQYRSGAHMPGEHCNQ